MSTVTCSDFCSLPFCYCVSPLCYWFLPVFQLFSHHDGATLTDLTTAKSLAPKKKRKKVQLYYFSELNKVLAAIQSLSANCEVIVEKFTSVETTVINTDHYLSE